MHRSKVPNAATLRYHIDDIDTPSSLPLKYQPHKMVQHTQTIRRQIADKLLEFV